MRDERYVVTMFMQHFGTPRDQEAREQLAAALPDGAEVRDPDENGIFDVVVEADDLEGALRIAWDAVRRAWRGGEGPLRFRGAAPS